MRALVYISDAVAKRLLTPAEAVRIAEQTLLAHARGQVIWSEPRMLNLHGQGLHTQYPVKACALLGEPIVGLRLTTLPDQPSGLPTRLMLLNDPESGEFLAVMDEEWAHSIRTGAAAAVAAKYLACPDAGRVGLVGVGRMARGALLALREALQVREVQVTSLRHHTRAAFAEEMKAELGIPVAARESVDAVAAESDVLIVSTSAQEPVIFPRHLHPGICIYSMGAGREVDPSVYRQVSRFVADDWEQLNVRADIQDMLRSGVLQEGDLHADLADIVSGKRPGRRSPDETVLVRSQGLVTQDTAQALWVYRRAVEEGLALTMQVTP